MSLVCVIRFKMYLAKERLDLVPFLGMRDALCWRNIPTRVFTSQQERSHASKGFRTLTVNYFFFFEVSSEYPFGFPLAHNIRNPLARWQ